MLELLQVDIEGGVELGDRTGQDHTAARGILMGHGEARLEAEVRWHQALLEALPSLAEGPWPLVNFDKSDLSS